MSEKYFSVSNPSQVVTIFSDQNSFYQLSDGNMIKKESFITKYQPVLDGFETEHISKPSYINTDYINPNSFFSSTSLSPTDINIIKSTDPSIVPNIPDGVERSEIKVNTTDRTNTKQPVQQSPQMNESLVTRVDNQPIPNNTQTDVSQYKVYDNDEEAYNDFINNSGITVKKPEPKREVTTIDPMIEINSLFDDELLAYGQDEANNRRNKRISKLNGVPQNNQQISNTNEQVIHTGVSTPNYQPTIDPIKMMFSTFKRSHEVTFNFEFKDKIANPEFIKMMMENMEGDIVGYYKKMIVDNIMKNLHVIESVVEQELKELLITEEEVVVKVNKPKRIIPKVHKEERSQLDEGTEDKKPKRHEIRVIPDVPTIPFTKEPRTKKVKE